jgi:hypothetical protein
MKLNKTFLMALMIILLWGPPLFAQQTADEIMRAYYNLPIPDTQITTITMVLREKDGTKVTRIMEAYLRETEDGTDNFMEFISPADVKGTRFLTLGNNEGSDDQRLWLPALQKTRKIASSDKGNSFMGSDLSYYDMESRFFSEATYEMAGEETIVVIMDGEEKQTDCWIIESTYIDPEAPYLKSLNWVSKENNFVYKSKI